MSGWYLDNAVARASEHVTFEIPSKAERTQLRVGDFAKLIFQCDDPPAGERMWVRVTNLLDRGHYLGVLDADATTLSLKAGDAVQFTPDNIAGLDRF